MSIVLGADKAGFELKELLKKVIKEEGFEVIDLSETPAADFVEAALAVSAAVLKDEDSTGIIIDQFGVGSYMAANKIKGMIAANVTDENSSKMTREHNGAKAITIGSGVVGKDLAVNLVKYYIHDDYAAGRHQVRVDMLNKML